MNEGYDRLGEGIKEGSEIEWIRPCNIHHEA